MARADFPIVGSLHQEIIPKVDAERTINLYEVQSPNGKKPSYLHPTPGKKQVGTLPFINGNFVIDMYEVSSIILQYVLHCARLMKTA